MTQAYCAQCGELQEWQYHQEEECDLGFAHDYYECLGCGDRMSRIDIRLIRRAGVERS